MADAIKSQSQNAIDLFDDLKFRVNEANAEYHTQVKSPLTITLGDEFQGVASGAVEAVQILMNFEENGLRNENAAEMRWVIWYGRIDTPINSEIAHGMIGPGLADARKALNGLKKRNMPRVSVKLRSEVASTMLNNAFTVYDAIRSRWDADDRRVVADFLMLNDYKKVAQFQGKTRSQIWKRKNNLMIEAYFAIKNLLINIASQDA